MNAEAVSDAIGAETIGERVWFYTNYQCNLACRYCLTSSSPHVPKRELDSATILALADDAVRLGFGAFGVTGGEPFVRRDMPELVAALARRLPVVVLTNGTLFTERFVVERLLQLATLPVALLISIDAARATQNDRYRGIGSHARALSGLARLRAHGLHVRIGATLMDAQGAHISALRELALAYGIQSEDQIVRPMMARGAAAAAGLGQATGPADVPPELTITVDGAFWSPASPTITEGKLDVGERLTRTIRPLDHAAAAMLRYAAALPERTRKVA